MEIVKPREFGQQVMENADWISDKSCCMKNKSFILYLFMVLVNSSCSEKYEVSNMLPPEEMLLEQEEYINEGCYFDMLCVNDSTLLLKAECDTFFFHLYNANKLDYISKFGMKGKAPCDFQFPFPYNTNTTNGYQNDTLIFYDMNLVCNKYINISNIIQKIGSISNNIRQEYVDEKLFYGKDLNIISNGKIIGTSINQQKGLFFIYDKKGKDIRWIDFHPSFSVDDRYKNSVYSCLVCANEKKGTVIVGYRHFDGVSFYTLNGELKKSIFFSQPKLPELSHDFSGVSNDYPIFFSRIYGTSERCYLLRIGRGLNSILESSNADIHTTILEFDWNGNLLNQYYFKNLLSSFCVDEEDKFLYGVYSNEEENEPYVHLLKFKLKDE